MNKLTCEKCGKELECSETTRREPEKGELDAKTI